MTEPTQITSGDEMQAMENEPMNDEPVYTVVLIDRHGVVMCFGQFESEEDAEPLRARIAKQLADHARDFPDEADGSVSTTYLREDIDIWDDE